jgi:hypothetical protein
MTLGREQQAQPRVVAVAEAELRVALLDLPEKLVPSS